MAKQTRPLSIRDPQVCEELDGFVSICEEIRTSIPSCVDVNESGPLRTVLAAIKKPLVKGLHNFQYNGVRGIFRRHLSAMQPAVLDHLIVVKKIQVKTPQNEFVLSLIHISEPTRPY